MVCALALALSAQAACGQTPPQSSDEALRAMEQMAGVIFAGQVIAVRRQAGSDGATGVVEIEFTVDDAVRGVSGGSYTLREWAGLWPAGDEPFRVGERFLMLLHATSAAGLSSPVGEMDGAIPIRGGGTAPALAGAPATIASAQAVGAGDATGADGLVVDMRWVQTRVVRPLAYRAESVARPTGMPGGVRANVTQGRAENLAETQLASGSAGLSTAAGATPSAEQPSEAYATVLGKLRSWVRVDHVER
jgi:hypothetical protein